MSYVHVQARISKATIQLQLWLILAVSLLLLSLSLLAFHVGFTTNSNDLGQNTTNVQEGIVIAHHCICGDPVTNPPPPWAS
ncbi:MAG: hypothetical protein AAF614_09305 [Chloroflexota bacterium]